MPDNAPKQTLTVGDAIAIIVGIVIGAGIFEAPSLVAGTARSEGLVLLAWLAGGVITLLGALCFAELATTYPHPGGNYYYLMRAFGPEPAFLFAWGRLVVIQTGSIALLGFVFGDYASQILRLGPYSSTIYAALAAVVLTAINIAGIRQGKWTQNSLSMITVVGLAVIIVLGFAAPAQPQTPIPATTSVPAGVGTMMIFILLTYGGWSEAVFVSAEVRNPQRNMSRALLGGMLFITLMYVLVNAAFLRGLGLAGTAQSEAVAADFMRRLVGERGADFVSLLVAIAALDSMNATIITGARSNYALGRDYGLFRLLGRWSRRGETPVNALLVQGAIALALVAFGMLARDGFRTMVEYTSPVFWLFFLVTTISLFVLRRRDPDVPRPFRVPGYPLVPILFSAVCAYMVYASLVYTGVGATVGAAALIAGVPFMMRFRREHRDRLGREARLTTETEVA
jgi:APA family basic amino acid/polyamine antiporter